MHEQVVIVPQADRLAAGMDRPVRRRAVFAAAASVFLLGCDTKQTQPTNTVAAGATPVSQTASEVQVGSSRDTQKQSSIVVPATPIIYLPTETAKPPELLKRVQTDFVHTDGRNFVTDGQKNMVFGMNRYNLLTVNGVPCGNTFPQDDLDRVFGEWQDMGITAVRHWFFRTFTEQGFGPFDQLLNIADKHKIRLLPVFENEWKDCVNVDPNYTTDGNKDDRWFIDGYKNGPDPYKQYVLDTVAQYKNESVIWGWQLGNEFETKSHAALQAFTDDMSDSVKQKDPNHILNLGTQGNGQPGAQQSDYDELYAGQNQDYLDAHDYSAMLPQGQTLPGDMFNGIDARVKTSIRLNKPLAITEFGIEATSENGTPTPFQDRPLAVSEDVRAELMAARIDAYHEAGIAAVFFWSGRDTRGKRVSTFDFLPDSKAGMVIRDKAMAYGR